MLTLIKRIGEAVKDASIKLAKHKKIMSTLSIIGEENLENLLKKSKKSKEEKSEEIGVSWENKIRRIKEAIIVN